MKDIAKCANPDCLGSFLRLSDGKLFISPKNAFNFVWLCEFCMKRYTVDWQNDEPRLLGLTGQRQRIS
jgi:hypothetical protein